MLVPHCSHCHNAEPVRFNPGASGIARARGDATGPGRRRAGRGSEYHGPFRINRARAGGALGSGRQPVTGLSYLL